MRTWSAPVVVSALRTAIGSFGGALKDISPTALGATCVRAVLNQAGADPIQVGHVVFGNVIHTEPRDMYLARVASMDGGVSESVPALTLNRLCGSGLQAIITAAQAISLGDADCVIAGGAESMSRAPHSTSNARWGARMGDTALSDMLVGALTDPFGYGHMGMTAENVARRFRVSRERQDELSVESHRRASAAIAAGYFDAQTIPIEVKRGREKALFKVDEHVRHDASLEGMSSLRPAFSKDGTVTAGNASGVNDGAAALLLMSEARAIREGQQPLARIIGYAHSGVDPSEMGIGPILAVRSLLQRTGLKVRDFDVIESNEAFAAQACAVADELHFDPAKTNPNGGAIALGHPIGATGAILMVKAIHELKRTEGRYGLITMCIGGGQGIAAAIERLN